MARSACAHEYACDPFGFDSKLRRAWRTRYWQVSQASLKVLGDSCDVEVFHPFADRRVLEAMAATGGTAGFGPRRELVRRLFGAVLPAAIAERTSKAFFDDQIWAAGTKTFARNWSGKGVDSELVDLERLHDLWFGPRPSIRTTTLLQAAWLRDQGLYSTEP